MAPIHLSSTTVHCVQMVADETWWYRDDQRAALKLFTHCQAIAEGPIYEAE